MVSSGRTRWAGVLLAALAWAAMSLPASPVQQPIGVRLMVATPTPAPKPPSQEAPPPLQAEARPVVPAPLPPGVVVDQRGGRRSVALTFDDGPDPAWTPQVLALLKRYRARATFCMIGENARANPALVRTVVQAGHRLCDHTQTHPLSVAVLDRAGQRAEVLGGRSDLAAVTTAAVRYFRAPGGNWSADMVKLAGTKKMVPLGWSVDPRDWSRPGVPAIVSAVQNGVHPGAIVLMHDGGGPRQQTVDALAQLLPWLVQQGYTFGFPTS